MRFWQDRVADIGLVVLGVALPCVVAAYFTWTEGRDQERTEAAAAAELARLEWTRGDGVGAGPEDVRAEERGGFSRTVSTPRGDAQLAAAAPSTSQPAAALVAPSTSQPAAALAPSTSQPTAALVPSTPSSALAARAGALRSTEARVRAEAVHALSHLDNDARAAMVARLLELAAHRPPAAEVAGAFAALRGASTGRWSDDDVDLASGVPSLLERDRSDRTLAVVEPLLYLRSLEGMLGGEGHADLALFIDLDDGAWLAELVRVRRRLGNAFVPALIAMRAHPSARVGTFAQAQLAAMGCDDPKRALSTTDPDVLARTVRAYASPLDYTAMPLVVRLVADSRIHVRQAARAAVAAFGRNAIWQLRELFDEVSGQPADKHWDHEQTARELYAVLDRPRLEEAETLLARGLQSLTRGDLGAMRRDYAALLTKYPDFEHRDRMAEGYAVLAADLFRSDALADSLATYRRALRLAPEAPNARRWQARVAFVSAELSLTHGVVDLTGYTRALELDPQLREAQDAVERLSGTRSEHVRSSKRLAAALALAMLLALVALLMRRAPMDRFSVLITPAPLPETKSEPNG